MRSIRHLAAGATIAAVALIAAVPEAGAEKFVCKSHNGTSPYPVVATPDHDHTRFGPDATELTKRFGAYVASFDGEDDDTGDGVPDLLAVPQWVASELKGVQPDANGSYEEPDISIDRPGDWYKASEFAFLWTNRPSVRKTRLDHSYDGIGRIWNRGHLAMADHAQRIGWHASCNTHFLWNAVPQAADMNQGPWRHLEDYIAALSNQAGRIWIVAGPVFHEDREIGFIGEPSKGEVPVAVPHALFKVVIRELAGGRVSATAFLFDQPYVAGSDGQPRPSGEWVNCSKVRGQEHVYDHRPRLRSVAEIEALTGLTFFADAPNREAERMRRPDALWPVEQQFWHGHTCAGQMFVN